MIYIGIALMFIGSVLIGFGLPSTKQIKSDGTEIIMPQEGLVSGIDQDGNFWFMENGQTYTVVKIEGDRPMYKIRYGVN